MLIPDEELTVFEPGDGRADESAQAVATTTPWAVERIVRFAQGREHDDGYALLGFHAPDGGQFALEHGRHWVGLYDGPDAFAWTAGRVRPPESRLHVDADVLNPMYVARAADGTYVVSNIGNGLILRIDPERRRADVLVDGASFGLRDVGNCVLDADSCIWVNEVTGCRIRRFDATGNLLATVGDGKPGFSAAPVPLPEARFGWIYDIRLGPDGRLYVLDSGNFAVRVLDAERGVVETVAGSGRPGYEGDGGDPRRATFGSEPDVEFDGPYSLSLDESGTVFVGDRYNRVVRMIDRERNLISTIAGDPAVGPDERSDLHERDPRRLKLPRICSMDYNRGRLFVPDESGDLAILVREPSTPRR